MKAFLEEYGVIVVAAIVIMIIVVFATPAGTSTKLVSKQQFRN